MNKLSFAGLPIMLLLAATGCYKNEPVPSADFLFTGSNQFTAPCNVQFTNLSTQSFSYEWWFGSDSSVVTLDSPGSTLKDPVFTYKKPGKYMVTLWSYTESRKEWASVNKTLIINDSVH